MKEKSSAIKAQINSLFPIPVYITHLNREYTSRELTFFKKTKWMQNAGNRRSTNSYILNSAPLTTLKKDMNIFLKDYFSKVVAAPSTVYPYITQSWLNDTKQTEFHHPHCHPNSFISVVLYIYANPQHDTITFHKNREDPIKCPVVTYNLYNSETWAFPIESKQIMIFPSDLAHSVTIKKESNPRISLSFNTFLKGKIGDNDKLSELII